MGVEGTREAGDDERVLMRSMVLCCDRRLAQEETAKREGCVESELQALEALGA